MNLDEALRVLELSMPLNGADLKKSYREALLVWHPDRFAGNDSLTAKANEHTRSINEAYRLLSRAMAGEEKRETEGRRREAQAPSPFPRAREAAEATEYAEEIARAHQCAQAKKYTEAACMLYFLKQLILGIASLLVGFYISKCIIGQP